MESISTTLRTKIKTGKQILLTQYSAFIIEGPKCSSKVEKTHNIGKSRKNNFSVTDDCLHRQSIGTLNINIYSI